MLNIWDDAFISEGDLCSENIVSNTLRSLAQTNTSSVAGGDRKWHLGFVCLRVLDKNKDYAE